MFTPILCNDKFTPPGPETAFGSIFCLGYSSDTLIIMQKWKKSRRRLNSTIATYMLANGSCCIRYPDIQVNAQFLDDDGVHISKLGNSIMLKSAKLTEQAHVNYLM
jgi:hypothetical protein